MQNSDDKKVDRRTFIQTAGAIAGSAIASTAVSYDRILGANDRIALGHIGIGNRGSGLHKMASRLKDKYNVETVAVCDLWRNNRERAATRTTEYYGRAPKAVQHPDELLAMKDVDAVFIATPEHSHSPRCPPPRELAAEPRSRPPWHRPFARIVGEKPARSRSLMEVPDTHTQDSVRDQA